MRANFPAVVCFAALLVNGAVLARDSLENIPLKWTPTSSLAEMGALDISGATLTTKVHFDTLVNTSENPSLIGQNSEKADKVRTVTTPDDVAAFVTLHLKETAHGAGLNIVDSGADVIVSGEIRRFFVTEVNTYGGEVSLLIHVKNAAGTELWTGLVSGDSTRWGRSYKAENYYEALSDMLLRAAYNLLANPGFHEALAKR
jgi:hypothetical protein